jgi:uncharacterized membrane protein
MAFCTKCGKQIPDEAKFCSGCGQPVVRPGAAPAAPQPVYTQPEPVVTQEAVNETVISTVPSFETSPLEVPEDTSAASTGALEDASQEAPVTEQAAFETPAYSAPAYEAPSYTASEALQPEEVQPEAVAEAPQSTTAEQQGYYTATPVQAASAQAMPAAAPQQSYYAAAPAQTAAQQPQQSYYAAAAQPQQSYYAPAQSAAPAQQAPAQQPQQSYSAAPQQPQQSYYAASSQPQQTQPGQQQSYYAAQGQPQPGQQTNYGYQQQGQPYQAHPADIAENKGICVLCYLGLLLLIPLLTKPNSVYVKYHSNQGLVLMLFSIAFSIVSAILAFIPWIGVLIMLAGYIFILVCVIMGIINAVNGNMKPLPLIGNITLLK